MVCWLYAISVAMYDCPYSHNAIIIHFIHVALFSASPYILLYFIEIISLLSFPFYLYNAYILFAFISMFVYVCMHVYVCVLCVSNGEGGEDASGSEDCYQIVLKHSMRIHMHCKSITLFSFCEIDFCVYVWICFSYPEIKIVSMKGFQ